MCHVYNYINEELPVHVHGYAVLEVLWTLELKAFNFTL